MPPTDPDRTPDERSEDQGWPATADRPEPPSHVTPLTPVQPNRGWLTPVRLALVIVALLGGTALFLSGFSLGRQTATTPGTPADEAEAFRPFWDTYRAITEKYAGGDVDRKKLIQGAIDGMFKALDDPYSSYLTPEEYRSTLQGISGQFEGIGAEVGTRSANGETSDCSELGPRCFMVIISPIEGSPAQKAGIRAGDVVTKIDGQPVDGLTLSDGVLKVRGPKGTTVVLTIVREGAEPIDVTIVRDVIVQKEVITKDLARGTVRYIRITGFSERAANEAVDAVDAAVKAGERKVILDLRGNPGGFVTAATTVASQFINDGPIFWEEDSDGTQVPTNAKPGGAATDPTIKLIVLVDRGSASASEIVAGALQDTKRATLVGETTFGKGTVQVWQELPDDTGGFRLTVAKWLTPEKRWVHHVGLKPDVAVVIPPNTPAGKDPILDRALELLDATAALDRAA